MTKISTFKKELFLTFVLCVFLVSFTFVTANAAVTNIAQGKTYSSSVQASTDYPDTNSSELTDGAYGTSNFKDAGWQGRQNVASYTQTVDFGDNSYLTDVSCRFLEDDSCAIYFPASVTFSCSSDGVNFVPMGTAAKEDVGTGIAKYAATLSNAVRTRYVKMTVNTAGEWTFEDEFEATGINDSPLNIAQTKKYTTSSPADSSYPDTNQKELTNGKYATNVFKDAEWQGHVGSYTVTLDLGTKMRVTSMDMNFLKYDGGGVYYPSGVSFESSDDNSTFTPLGSAAPQGEVNSTQKYLLNLSAPINTRYIKVNITAASDTSWVFADELEAFGYPIISGSFIQLSYGDIWTEADWEEEFDYMKDLGMDHVILQWIVDFSPSTKDVYYNSPSYNSSTGYDNRNNQDTLLNVLTAGKKKGIDVWIGLGANDEWWDDATDQTWLTSEAGKNKNVIKEIWDSPVGYKNFSSLKGWYSVWEIENYRFSAQADQQKLRTALKTIVDYAHSYTNKPIMSSPYIGGYSTGLNPDGWRDMWTYLLDPADGANFDVIAPQDSFGNLADTYLPAMRQAVDTNPKCELWSNLETYDPDVGCAEPTITMLNQLNTEIPYVSKMTSFSYLHYHSPKVVGWAENDDWKRVIYPRLGKTYTGPAMGYEDKAAGKSYTASVPASSQYPDTDSAELTNKKYAGSVGYTETHYQGRQNVSSYQFIVDLQKQTSFLSTSLNFIQQLDSSVVFPQNVTYYASTDGVSYSQIGSINKPSTTLDASANHYQLDLTTPVTARYVKAVVTTGTSDWTFCDEMEVIGAR
jgi:F5/8 type C domain.